MASRLRGQGGGYWTEGSVLGAKANNAVPLPTVKFDSKVDIFNANENNVGDLNLTCLGRPHPIRAVVDGGGRGEDESKKINNNKKSNNKSNNNAYDETNNVHLHSRNNELAKGIGKFKFQPATHPLAKKLADDPSILIPLCNLHDVFIEQDFFVLSKSSKDGDRSHLAILRQQSKPAEGEGDPDLALTPLADDNDAHFDVRSVFKVRLQDADMSAGTKLNLSEAVMQRARNGLTKSFKQRQGVSTNPNPNSTRIQGGENFAMDLRLRSMNAENNAGRLSLGSTRSAVAKSSPGGLHKYFGDLYDEVGEREIIVGSGMGQLESSGFGGGYSGSPVKIRNVKSMELPSLRPSEFKLAKDMRRKKEEGGAELEAEPSLDSNSSVDLFKSIFDEGFVLGEPDEGEELLMESITQPVFSKLLEVDRQVREQMEYEAYRLKSSSPTAPMSPTNIIATMQTEGTIDHVNMAVSPTNINHTIDHHATSLQEHEVGVFNVAVKPNSTWRTDLKSQDKNVGGHINFENDQERKKGVALLMTNIKNDLATHTAAKMMEKIRFESEAEVSKSKLRPS